MTGESGDPRRGAVLAALHRHHPADRREAEHLARTVALVEESPFPFDRTAFTPGHLTASGFVADPSGTRVLLVLHGTIGAWLQPGGHVDATDRDAAAAAVREIAEETGVAGLDPIGGGILDVDVHSHPGKPGREPPHLHFDLRFGFRAAGDALDPNHEVRDARWVAPSDLGSLGADESVARPMRTLFGLLRPPSS